MRRNGTNDQRSQIRFSGKNVCRMTFLRRVGRKTSTQSESVNPGPAEVAQPRDEGRQDGRRHRRLLRRLLGAVLHRLPARRRLSVLS